MIEIVLVQGPSVLARTSQPGGDGGLSGSEDALCGGRIQSFGQRRQDHGDVLGRGFQAIQGGVAPGAERGAAGLTAERLDPFGLTMLAIANKSMHMRIRVTEV